MTSFVLDASAALSWAFEEEKTPQSQALLTRCGTEVCAVPVIFWLELTNTLLVSERRGRIDRDQLTTFLEEAYCLMIDVDKECEWRAGREVLDLARQYALTTYDAAYLELARRRCLPLATLDKALIRAAQSAGVALVPV